MNFLEEVWLVAEIAEMRIAGAGHCYLDLVEKKMNELLLECSKYLEISI